jgi:CRISPR-associated protein Cmr2
MDYLLSISIGPVQEFITTARRSRDLWFGSWLLSDLSKTAARTIADKYGVAALIFPSIKNKDELKANSSFNVVNKILVKLDGNEESIRELTKEIDEKIKDRLTFLAELAFDKLEGKNICRNVADNQLEDLVEFYWAAIPINGDYARARDEVERLLAARKATRNFNGVSWHFNDKIKHAPKSSLDGQRESVINEEVYKTLSEEELYRKFGVRKGERLCGVGLLKRHGNAKGDDSFFSTSHVAALPLLASVDHANHKHYFDKYIDYLKTECKLDERNGLNEVPVFEGTNKHQAFGRYDGHLLFKERLRDYVGNEKLEQAQGKLRDLLNKLKVEEPSPYYALLLGDGDFMGKAINEQTKNGLESHQKLSEQLSAFAGSVRDIVQKEHKGSLVYSGGDDVLAFVPLHEVLYCARNLAKDFRKKLEDFKLNDDKAKSPTLSIGIVIAHHLDSMSDALERVRQAEKIAKSIKGKDALAITVSKRGGVPFTVKGKWGKIDKRLHWFTQLHLTEAIPDGAAYELRELAHSFQTMPDSIRDSAMKDEAMRILKRKRVRDEKLADEILNKLKEMLTNQDVKLEDLAHEIIAARTFAKAMNQAAVSVKDLAEKMKEEEEPTTL